MSITVLGASRASTSPHLWSTDTDVIRHPHPQHPGRPHPELDPRFVFDFRAADDPGDGTALLHLARRRAAVPRPRATPRLGGDQPGRRRHRARHPQDRQGGRRLPARAGRPRRPRPAGRDGRQALPRRGAPHLPPQHAPTPRAAAPGTPATPGPWPRRPRTAAPSRPASGRRPEWEALNRFWLAGVPVPYPVQIDGTEILMELVTVDGEAGAAAGADPAARRPAGVVLRPAARRDGRRWPGTAWRTATCRRTTSWPRVSGWWSSTCRRRSTSWPTRRAWTS